MSSTVSGSLALCLTGRLSTGRLPDLRMVAWELAGRREWKVEGHAIHIARFTACIVLPSNSS